LSVSLKTKLRAGVRFALEQVRELGLWMLLGVLLGTAVETFIPEDTFTHHLSGSSLLGLVAALVVAGLFPAQGPCQGPGSAQDGHRGLGRGQSHPATCWAAPGEQRGKQAGAGRL
jgi:hypothetical protein